VVRWPAAATRSPTSNRSVEASSDSQPAATSIARRCASVILWSSSASDAVAATLGSGPGHADYELQRVLARVERHIAGLSAELHPLHDLLRRRRG